MTRVIVIVEDGIVQAIYSNNPDGLEIDVIDHDEIDDPSISDEYKNKSDKLKKEIDGNNLEIVY